MRRSRRRVKMRRMTRMRTKRRTRKMIVRINLKMRMRSLILLSLRMITRTLKESGRSVSMMKRSKNIQGERANWKNKETRSIQR